MVGKIAGSPNRDTHPSHTKHASVAENGFPAGGVKVQMLSGEREGNKFIIYDLLKHPDRTFLGDGEHVVAREKPVSRVSDGLGDVICFGRCNKSVNSGWNGETPLPRAAFQKEEFRAGYKSSF